MRISAVLCAVLVCVSINNPKVSSRTESFARAQNAPGEYDNLEALLETSSGPIVIEFFAKDAPRHVENFVKNAREGAYDGTTFHRLVKYALIQGGDPLSKNPRDRARYGTGGLNTGLPDEINKNKTSAGRGFFSAAGRASGRD